MGTQRWCPCGFVAVWRRDELSRLKDTSDVLLLCGHDGPGRLNVDLMKDFRVNNIHMHCTRDFMYMDKND